MIEFLYFLLFSALILVMFRAIKIKLLPVFLLINFTVIVNLVFGGLLTKLFLGNSFVQPNVDLFILSSIFVPCLLFFFITTVYRENLFNTGNIKPSTIIEFKNYLNNIFSYSRYLFFPLSLICILTMFSKGLFFRDFYRYVIEFRLGLILTLTYTSGIFTFLYYAMNKKYLFSLSIFIFIILLGKKHPLVFLLLLPFFFQIFTQKKISILLLISPVIIIVAFGFLGLFLGNVDISLFKQLSSSFDYYYNFNYFIKTYPLGLASGDIFFTSFYKFIPRIIWTSKPEVYGFLLIHSKIYYTEMANNFYPSVFEEYAEYLADFGWYLGWLIIVIKKTFWYCVFFLKNMSIINKFFVILFFLDPFLIFYIIPFHFFFKNKKLKNA